MSAQEHVSETLRRAVSGNRVAHAYLFCGPRGVGKTTLARVLAMALNCPNRDDDGEPCGSCESCVRIWGGQTALDVVEIDAASNRGVDDARELRERAMYAPSEEGRYKVYILDEAHMLTREAWNALLKILEEPPSRVIFIFATTEPQKIQQSASPILSRCQRFDFRRIGAGDITRRLREVVEGESVQAPEEALHTMARRAGGGMRDGLSLLDQVLALTGGEITQEAVRSVLGLVEEERYLELLDILCSRTHHRVFPFVEALLEEGYDMVEFHRGLIDTLRDLLRLSLGEDPDAMELREDLVEAFLDRASAFSPGDLVRMLAQATELEATGSLRRSAHPRLLLEMLLLRLSYLDRTLELEALLEGLGGERAVPREAQPASGSAVSGGVRDASGVRAGESEPSVRAPKPEESTGEAAGDESAESLTGAWERLLESPERLPRGIVPFLRASRAEASGDGLLILFVHPGPGLERLQDPAVLRAVRDALAPLAPGAFEFEIRPAAEDESPRTRITEETVKRGRLQELVEKEPTLGEAVEELDLELLD